MNRIKRWIWFVMDDLMARLIRHFHWVPEKTFEAISEQPWLFSTREIAKKKIGVDIFFDELNKKLICKVVPRK